MRNVEAQTDNQTKANMALTASAARCIHFRLHGAERRPTRPREPDLPTHDRAGAADAALVTARPVAFLGVWAATARQQLGIPDFDDL